MNVRLATANTKAFVGVLLVIYITIAIAVIVAIIAVVRLDTTGKRGSGLSKEFVYDVKDLAKIDPNLILYEETGAIGTGFKVARGIAVGFDGHVYVAGDKSIRVVFGSHRLPDDIKLADMPRCLTVAGDGKIYVGFKEHLEIYDAQGKRLATWQRLGDDAVLTSIAVSKNDVFVADAGNRIVHRFDTTGKLINRIGGKDKDRNIPGFVIPSPYFDLAVGRDGLLRVSDPGRHLIEAYTFDGDLEFSWGSFSAGVEGFCGCCNPVNFAILADESFVTCEKGLIRVKIADRDGVFVCVVAGPEQLVEGGASRVSEFGPGAKAGAFDVAVDTSGRIFVLDTHKGVVRIFTRKKEE